MLFSDATILTETPPLRACWSKVGHQAEVPITGNRDKRVVFGALNPATGAVLLDESAKWNQDAFQSHLRSIRARWRGWRLLLFVDRGSPHTAGATPILVLVGDQPVGDITEGLRLRTELRKRLALGQRRGTGLRQARRSGPRLGRGRGIGIGLRHERLPPPRSR